MLRRLLTGQIEAGEQADSADLTAVEPAPERAKARGELGPPTTWSVFMLSLPAIVEQLIQAAVGLTDTVIAGHIPGDEKRVAAAAAAVGAMSYIQWLAGLLNAAFAVGATAIVARSIGAKRYRVANRVAGTAVTSAFLLSSILAVFLFMFSSQVTYAVGLREQAHEFGRQYLHIMTITIALQGAAMIGTACLRGTGDTARPMLITAGVAAVNIVTSSSFCFGWLGAPAWGLRGNAFGTMIAYLLGGTATLVVLRSGRTRIKLEWRHFRVVGHILRRLLKIGFPAWCEGLLLWLGQILIVIFVIASNDSAVGISGATMAAHSAVIRIESLAFLPGFGFGIACSALVGQYLGANRPNDALKATRLANRLAVATMTAAALPMVLFPKFLLGLMVSSAPVVAIGVWPMILAGLAQPGFALSIVKGAGLKGAGETVLPMVSTVLGMVVVRVPMLLLCLFVFSKYSWVGISLTAVWIGIFADLNFRGVMNWAAFRRGTWMAKRI